MAASVKKELGHCSEPWWPRARGQEPVESMATAVMAVMAVMPILLVFFLPERYFGRGNALIRRK